MPSLDDASRRHFALKTIISETRLTALREPGGSLCSAMGIVAPLATLDEARAAIAAFFDDLALRTEELAVLDMIAAAEAALESFRRAPRPKAQRAIEIHDALNRSSRSVFSESAVRALSPILASVGSGLERDIELLRRLRNRIAHGGDSGSAPVADAIGTFATLSRLLRLTSA